MAIDEVMDKPMTVDELLQEAPEIYDEMFDPHSMEWGNIEGEVREILVQDPYGVIYGLMQSIKALSE